MYINIIISMKVLFSTVPNIKKRRVVDYPPVYPPLGLMYICSQIKNKLPEVDICLIDGLKIGIKAFWNRLKKENPDIIGLSFTTLNSADAFQISKQIKSEFPNSLLIAGGPHTSFLPKETLQRGTFDIGIIGEGELTMLDIIMNFYNNKIKKIKTISGIAFRKKNKIIFTKNRRFITNLDSIPFPERDEIKITDYPGFYYSKSKPDTSFLSIRGCPYDCVFCANPWKIGKPRVRLRSPSNIAEELKELAYKYKIKEVYDWSDEFNINTDWTLNVCKQIQKEKLDISFKAQFRVDKITSELAKNLNKTGFWLALVGIESANPRTLRGIEKHITINQITKACEKLKKYDIKVLGYFIGFNIWEKNGKLMFENVEKTRNTLKFIKKLSKNRLIDYFSFSIATPYPGSKLYTITKKHNLISENFEEYTSHEPVISLPGISKEEILRVKKEAVRLQAKDFIKSGGFNFKLIKFYAEKFYEVMRLSL